jgi:hypothetical protein
MGSKDQERKVFSQLALPTFVCRTSELLQQDHAELFSVNQTPTIFITPDIQKDMKENMLGSKYFLRSAAQDSAGSDSVSDA